MIGPLLIALTFGFAVPAAQGPANGRVVATITALEGTVHLSGVDVDLRSPDGGTTLARTMTDARGQVTFPDIPPGRYVVTARRPGFLDQDSAPFDVRAGETVQVLLDIHLTFVAPAVDVRAPTSPTPALSV